MILRWPSVLDTPYVRNLKTSEGEQSIATQGLIVRERLFFGHKQPFIIIFLGFKNLEYNSGNDQNVASLTKGASCWLMSWGWLTPLAQPDYHGKEGARSGVCLQ